MSQTLPLFPLPQITLFPRTTMALHFFEPRYRAMMDAVMERNQHFVIAELREGWQEDYQGKPPIHRIAATARVLVADRTEDGRWNAMVEGVDRVRVQAEVPNDPFRLVRVEEMVELMPDHEVPECLQLMRQVAAVAEAVGARVPELRRTLTNLVNTHRHPSVVCDIIAGALVRDAYSRRSMLGELNVRRRLRLLAIQLGLLREELRRRGIEVELPAAEG